MSSSTSEIRISPVPSSHGHRTSKTGLTRRRGACEACKVKKIRCDGNQPCHHCDKAKHGCSYLNNTRKHKRQRQSISDGTALSPTALSTAGESQGELMNQALPTNKTNRSSYPSSSPSVPSVPSATFSVDATNNDFSDKSWMDMIFDQQTGESFGSLSSLPLDESYLFYSNQVVPALPEDLELDTSAATQAILSRDSELMQDVLRGSLLTMIHMPFSSKYSPTMSISDQIFNVDFSTEAIPSYLDSRSHRLDTAQQKLIRNIFKKLIATQDEKDVSDLSESIEQQHSMSYDQETIVKYIDACYKEPENVGSFLDRSYLDHVIEVNSQQQSSNPAGQGLINAVLAIGCHYLEPEEHRKITAGKPCKSLAYFEASLATVETLALSENTLLKLQALLSMAVFSLKLGLQTSSILIAQATQCAQALGLNSEKSIQSTWTNSKDQLNARKAFWFLYALEKPYCLRRGTFSIIDDDFIDHLPPSDGMDSTNWTLSNCQYAKICSLIVKHLYSQTALQKSVTYREGAIDLLCDLLNRWLQSLPPRFHFVTSAKVAASTGDESDRRQGLKLLCQYHEAILAIHGPWVGIFASSSIPSEEKLHVKCETACVDSARTVLLVASHATSLDLLADHAVLRCSSIAVRIIFLAIITGLSAQDNMSCLGLACGIFGKMSMNVDVPLTEIIELSMAARTFISKRLDLNKS